MVEIMKEPSFKATKSDIVVNHQNELIPPSNDTKLSIPSPIARESAPEIMIVDDTPFNVEFLGKLF